MLRNADKRRGDRSRPARPGLSLDAAFVSADIRIMRRAVGDEIDIRSSRRKLVRIANASSLAGDIDNRQILNRHDLVRYAAVDEVDAQVLRFGHLDFNQLRRLRGSSGLRDNFRADIPGQGLEAHPVRFRRTDLARESCNASRTVAAHLGLGSVGIEELHPKVEAVRLLHENDALAADARLSRAHKRHPPTVVSGKRPFSVVDHDEVVAGAVHLDETDFHHHQPLASGTSSPSFMRMRSISTL